MPYHPQDKPWPWYVNVAHPQQCALLHAATANIGSLRPRLGGAPGMDRQHDQGWKGRQHPSAGAGQARKGLAAGAAHPGSPVPGI